MEDIQDMIDAIEPTETSETEKLIPESRVNEIVQHQKEKAARKARREVEEEYQRKAESAKPQSNASQFDEDAVYQRMQERANKEAEDRRQSELLHGIAEKYVSIAQEGREKYADFDSVLQDLDPEIYPHLTYLLSNVENAADVMHEIANNATKLSTLDNLARRNTKKAISELNKLSKSISENDKARASSSSYRTNEPLDHLSSSKVSGGNGGESIEKLRKADWLRG